MSSWMVYMCRRQTVFQEKFCYTFFFRHFSQNRMKLLLFSSRLSVCLSAWNNSALTGWIFMKFDIWVFSKISQEIFQVSLNRILYMKTNIQFLLYFAQFFLEWEMFRTEIVEKIKTHFLFSNFIFENRAVYEIMWKNIVEWGRPQMTMWRAWIPRATNTHFQNI